MPRQAARRGTLTTQCSPAGLKGAKVSLAQVTLKRARERGSGVEPTFERLLFSSRVGWEEAASSLGTSRSRDEFIRFTARFYSTCT